MKKIIILLSIFFVVSLVIDTTAQSKKEKKKEYKTWKKKKKKLHPLDYKRMVDELSSLKGKVSTLSGQVSDLEQELQTKDNQISSFQSELDNFERRYAVIEENLEKCETEKKVEPPEAPTEKQNRYDGVVFKVQIGAFRNKDLTKYFEDNSNFTGDVDEDGIKKYTLMVFTDYWEADEFKKYIREMGVKDAWIVSYKDGKRVPIDDVLEGG